MTFFRKRAADLALEECECDERLFNIMQTTLRLAADIVELRFHYLQVVPWSFVQADTPEGAREFLRGATSKPLAQQDELTVHLYVTFRSDLEALASGGECSARLREAISEMCEVPVDESAGEGYHRSTNAEKIRSRHAKRPHLKASTRRKQTIKLIKFFNSLGAPGRRVIRYEWVYWKRILQVDPRRFWQKVKMRNGPFLERVYRMDTMSEIDWSLICTRIHAPGQGPAPTPAIAASEKTIQALHTEYLQCALKPPHWYVIDVHLAGMDADGNPETTMEKAYFQIINVVTSRSRPHLMPTIESHEEIVNTSVLAFLVQEASPKPDVVCEGDGVVVFPDAEPMWKRWHDLGPFHIVRSSLLRFSQTGASVGNEGCLLLWDAVRAVPDHALTDSRCPALIVLVECHRRGWRSVLGSVTHTDVEVGPMDGREATKMKAYYVALLQLSRCLPLAGGSMPSIEPVLFYRLLLSGVAVLPGLGQRGLLALQRSHSGLAIADAGGEAEESDSEERFLFHPKQ